MSIEGILEKIVAGVILLALSNGVFWLYKRAKQERKETQKYLEAIRTIASANVPQELRSDMMLASQIRLHRLERLMHLYWYSILSNNTFANYEKLKEG